jgi:glycosyltransferase involved in cell wall biosynthesis
MPNGSPAGRTKIRSRLRAAGRFSAHALVNRVPESLRYDAWKTIQSGRDFARGSARLLRDCVRALATTRESCNGTAAAVVTPPAEPFAFRPDDVYISMGLDWANNDLDRLDEERRRLGFKTLLFCYDTIPIRFPHLVLGDFRPFFKDYFRRVARTADRVVAISQTSRRDFLEMLEEEGDPKPPVDVVILGTDLTGDEAQVHEPDPGLDGRPFVLYVSTIEARKNHQVLFHAWERLVEKHGDEAPILLLVGWVGWGVDDLLGLMRTHPRLKHHIRIESHIKDGELTWLYRNCLFTVFPSLYEGWGLPVVESLALGKPCICSTAPAVVEASQGMATALDPLDLPAWVAAVERLWLDPEARDLATRRLREFRAQTWREHGESLVAIARNIGV